MFCINCGNELPNGSLFCTVCGQKIEGKKSTIVEERGNVFYPSNGSPIIDKIQQVKYSEPTPNEPPPIMSPSIEPQSTQKSVLEFWGKLNKQYVGVAVATVVMIIVILISTSGGRAINSVKNGVFYGYPEQTVSEAFNNFFADPEWKSYKQYGDTYVKFTGICLLNNEEATAKFIFLVDGKDFTVERLNVGNMGEYTTEDLESFLESIYSE